MQTFKLYISLVASAFLKTIYLIICLFIPKGYNMRVDKLRDIFSDSRQVLVTGDALSEQLLDELINDDLVKVKSAVIAVQHFMTLANIYSVRYPDTFDAQLPALKSKSYNKIYTLIENVNIDTLSERDFSLYSDEVLVVEHSLDSLLMFFESIEEYHKCAKIKKISDILKTRKILSA